MTLLPLLLACRPDPAVAPVEVDDWDPSAPLKERCFSDLGDPVLGVPDYDAFAPVVPRHCMGTDHQDIDAVGKLVFLGDSVTAGTPPTPSHLVYRAVLERGIEERFGSVEVANCAEWGAEVPDLLGAQGQLEQCLGEGVEPLPTLIVWTMGGNDLAGFANDMMGGTPLSEIEPRVDAVLADLEQALTWLSEAEAAGRFPGGVHVVFANVYEYTDGTGDMGLCPAADLLGFAGEVPDLRSAAVRLNEGFVRLAVQTGTDVLFLLEQFCGHGFLAGDPDNECYRGPEAVRWFDDSCIHPTPEGHQQIADMFLAVIDE